MKNITLLIIFLSIFFLSFNFNTKSIKRYNDTFSQIYYVQNKNIISVDIYSIFENGDSLECSSDNRSKCIRQFKKYDILKQKEVFNSIYKNKSSIDFKTRRKLKLLLKQNRKTGHINLNKELKKAGFSFVFIQTFHKKNNSYIIDYHDGLDSEITCFPTRLIFEGDKNRIKMQNNETGIHDFLEL